MRAEEGTHLSTSRQHGRKRRPGDLGRTEIILDSIADGVFTVGPDWRITSFNRAAERITGVSRKEAIGKPCSEVFRASMCEADCALRRPGLRQIDEKRRRIVIARKKGNRDECTNGMRESNVVGGSGPGVGCAGSRTGEGHDAD